MMKVAMSSVETVAAGWYRAWCFCFKCDNLVVTTTHVAASTGDCRAIRIGLYEKVEVNRYSNMQSVV